MLKRLIEEKLKKNIKHIPAVVLLGARQVGKTTLARKIHENFSSIYLDLEAPEDLFKLSDPTLFLAQYNDKLVILDEIQRTPNLFMILRGLIDKNRAAGRKSGNFLLLGSASMDLLRQSSESLAGRISYLEMSGLNILEIHNEAKYIRRLWFRGGFPDSYLATTDKLSFNWLENLVRSYLERDIVQMGFRISATKLRRFWTMMAHLQGETINCSKLASNLEIDAKTVSHYIDILIDLLLIRCLNPWYTNVKKRLVKSSRFYIRDSGILHRLLGISNYDELLSHPVVGKSWECFAIENILFSIPLGTESYFYRTAAGAEIDLLLKLPNNELWAIEIKNGIAPKITRGFHQASEDVKVDRKYIVYSGDDEFPIGDNTTIISLYRMALKLYEYER